MQFYKKLKQVMIDFSSSPPSARNARAKQVLKHTWSFIHGGSYTSVKHKELILKNLNVSPKELAKKSDVSEQAIAKARYRIFQDLEECLSPAFITFLEKKQWEKAWIYLGLATTPHLGYQLFFQEFLQSLKKQVQENSHMQLKSYPLKDCQDEISILRPFFKPLLQNKLEELETAQLQKLRYLFELYDGNIGSIKERYHLHQQLLNGN
ncbi:hypothetical protein BN997_00530 [Oceanobacillus oncorhynchi]|uniref:Uncharacterized protein n=1 Tax=Oceanobacillus oncorhynchi TaxID=545501 RepID=A0A0A1MNR6_9BACI|nr:hypothetical protein [Oceanobacillus oncorhynchi]CEI80721.1 hypothetical protein BN997_00530 [Oceanobacillus oncorhynchi]